MTAASTRRHKGAARARRTALISVAELHSHSELWADDFPAGDKGTGGERELKSLFVLMVFVLINGEMTSGGVDRERDKWMAHEIIQCPLMP